MRISKRALIAWPLLAATIAAAMAIGLNRPDDADLAAFGITRLHTSSETGYHISYLWRGSAGGQQVIFIHDSPGTAANWRYALSATPPGFAAVAIDRPGFGESLPVVPATRLDAQVAAIAPLLRAAGPAGAILVGRGWGCVIAQAAADEHGDKVRGVVVVPARRDGWSGIAAGVMHSLDWPPAIWLLSRGWRHALHEQRSFNADDSSKSRRIAKVATVYVSDQAAISPDNADALWAAIGLLANAPTPTPP